MKNEDVLYLIPANVLNALVSYLSNKPWLEVNQVMDILQNLELYKESDSEV